VTNFARPPAHAAGPHQSRTLPIAFPALLAAMLVSLAIAAPAGAIVTTVEGTSVGLQPRNATTFLTGRNEVREAANGKELEAHTLTGAGTFSNDNGNAVLHGVTIYPVYWDPGDVFHVHHEWMTNIDRFFQQLGAGSGQLSTIFSTLGQYRDRSNTGAAYSITYKGAYTDFVPYPETGNCTDPSLVSGSTVCLTDAQLRAQLQSFVATQKLPTGMGTVYDILTPPGVTVCADEAGSSCSDFSVTEKEAEKDERNSASYKASFCSYHGDINPDNTVNGDGKTILYAAIPWTAGFLGEVEHPDPIQLYFGGAFDCQDGGWNPAENKETREKAHEPSEAEQKILNGESGTAEEAQAIEERLLLEGPHQQEPNQEGKGEEGDYTPGLSDLIVNQIAVEQANIETDPLLSSWQDSQKREVSDLCRNTFANTGGGGVGGGVAAEAETDAGTLSNEVVDGHNYYINNVFNLGDEKCAGVVGLVPRFTAANPVNSGDVVGFDGLESTVSLLEGRAFGPSGPPTKTYATFTWNFGDGTVVKGFAPDSPVCEAPWLSPCAGSVFHTYAYGGTYEATLTVTDVAGNLARVTEPIVVSGPPAPGASSTTGATTPPGKPAPGAKGSVPGKPVATAAVTSRSLRTTLRKGLVVHYSVNEQVTGHFEVLLSRSLARKLKIGGAAATGLPAGTPPMVVIAKALLVTTKGGHSTVDIKFSKQVAAKLKHAHSAPLMVRLIVRNASSTSPATTTVLSSVKLSG
jgi:hypothetical protein